MPAILQSERPKRPPVPPNSVTTHSLTPNWLRSALSPPPLNLALFSGEAAGALVHTVSAITPSDHPKPRLIPPNSVTLRDLTPKWLCSALFSRPLKLALLPQELVYICSGGRNTSAIIEPESAEPTGALA